MRHPVKIRVSASNKQTACREQSSSREANGHSASQEFYALYEPKILLPCSQDRFHIFTAARMNMFALWDMAPLVVLKHPAMSHRPEDEGSKHL
jgi:hypothetical protein